MVFFRSVALLELVFCSFVVYASSDEKTHCQSDGLEVVRSFVASPEFEKYRCRVQQGNVLPPLEMNNQHRSASLWQGIMNDVLNEREQQSYLEKKQVAQVGLASYGMHLDSDSDSEDSLQGADLSFLSDEKFFKEFESKLNKKMNLTGLGGRNINGHLNSIAYQSLSDIKFDRKLHKVVWNAIKIQSYTQSSGQHNVEVPVKKSPKLVTQVDAVKPTKQSPKRKILTAKQKAKDAADHEFLDRQVQIAKRQEEKARDRLLEDSVQEFNNKKPVKANKKNVKSNRVGLLHQEILRVYEGGGSELIEFLGAYNGPSSNDLVANSEFNNKVDSFLVNMGIDSSSRSTMKAQLMNQLIDSASNK